ncbi:MAG: hypothetical protein WD425_04345 [Nitrospirales bacterium]
MNAAESGRFSVYGVNTIEEALELLTGIPAGDMQPDGQYPPNTIFGLAAQRLTEMAKIAAEWSDRHSSKFTDRSDLPFSNR